MKSSPITCRNFINGKFVEGGKSKINVVNPANGRLIGTVPETEDSEVDAAIDAAEKAQKEWAKRTAQDRAGFLRKLAALIREQQEPLARTITGEQGKVLPLARVEVEFTAGYLEYMAEWARRIEGEIIPSDRANEHIFLFRQPIGVVAGILPWNFPFFLIARKLAPALVTGNTIVIKPSEETPLNAHEFAKFVEAAGVPAGVVNFVHGRGATVGRRLTGNRKVGLISFTGSVETGSRIMAAAAENITRVNLELGGKAPAIVMPDANLAMAAEAIKSSRVINSGQVCNCAERIYVHRRVAEEFTDKLVRSMSACKWGDPLTEEGLDYGPMINRQGMEKVKGLISGAVAAGARVVAGGQCEERGGGFYCAPTVLADCRQDMAIIKNEIFGPVAPVVVFDDLDEAITMANDSDYGLTSSIYTNDLHVAMRACREIRFGETYINRENFEAMQGYHAGWRKSGIGGADGKHGLHDYMQTHVVYLQYNENAK